MKLIKSESGNYTADYVNINYSGILSHLICKAGTACKSYASDLFISWKSVDQKFPVKQNFSSWFGFREMGVDHDSFIRSRLSNSGLYGSGIYAEIYKLEVSYVPYDSEWYDPDEGRIYLKLYEVNEAEALKALKEEEK